MLLVISQKINLFVFVFLVCAANCSPIFVCKPITFPFPFSGRSALPRLMSPRQMRSQVGIPSLLPPPPPPPPPPAHTDGKHFICIYLSIYTYTYTYIYIYIYKMMNITRMKIYTWNKYRTSTQKHASGTAPDAPNA